MLWLTTRHKALQQHAWRWLAALGSPQYTIQSLQTHFQDYDHVSTAFSSRSNQYWGTCLPSHHLLHTVPPHHIDSQSLNPKPTHHSASTRYPRGGIPRGPADTDEHPGAPVHPDEGHLPAQWRTERFPCLTQLHHARKKIKGDRLSKNAIPVLSNVLTSRALLLGMGCCGCCCDMCAVGTHLPLKHMTSFAYANTHTVTREYTQTCTHEYMHIRT